MIHHNTPQAIEAYMRRVADPNLIASIDRVQPRLRASAWQAGLIIINENVQIYNTPRQCGYSRLMRDYNYTLAQIEEHQVCSFTSNPESMLYCTCNDTSAPSTQIADRTCKHIIAYLLATAVAVAVAA